MSIDPRELVAQGPRVTDAAQQYQRIVATIAQGASLHYGSADSTADPDLDLLRGDERYATGLSLLAARGDLPAVAALADVISLVALAQAKGDSDLAAAVWEAGVTEIGWGSSPAISAAKCATIAGATDAAAQLRAAAAAQRSAAVP